VAQAEVRAHLVLLRILDILHACFDVWVLAFGLYDAAELRGYGVGWAAHDGGRRGYVSKGGIFPFFCFFISIKKNISSK
jgi:hypothetical protein